MDQTGYLPPRFTFSLLGHMPPLCLLLAIFCLQQQWTTLCLCLVKNFNFPLKLNFFLFVFKEELVVVVILKGSTDMIQPVTHGQLRGG